MQNADRLMESFGKRLPSDSAREVGLISETAGRLKRQESRWKPRFAAAVVAPKLPNQAEYFSGECYSQSVPIQTPGQPS